MLYNYGGRKLILSVIMEQILYLEKVAKSTEMTRFLRPISDRHNC